MVTPTTCPKRLLTDGEAASLLRISRTLLVRFAKRGEVPAVRLPDGDIRFDETDLWRWVESHKTVEAPAR
jgi:excisionase family DNA binding protein